MKSQFKCKTSKIFALNCSGVLVYSYATLKRLLDPLVVTKVNLVGGNTCQEL